MEAGGDIPISFLAMSINGLFIISIKKKRLLDPTFCATACLNHVFILYYELVCKFVLGISDDQWLKRNREL
jgi:hypothetical protein